jgi:hypothetical protein
VREREADDPMVMPGAVAEPDLTVIDLIAEFDQQDLGAAGAAAAGAHFLRKSISLAKAFTGAIQPGHHSE